MHIRITYSLTSYNFIYQSDIPKYYFKLRLYIQKGTK